MAPTRGWAPGARAIPPGARPARRWTTMGLIQRTGRRVLARLPAEVACVRAARALACCVLAAAAASARLIQLPPGVMEIASPIEVTGSGVEVRGEGTVLRAAHGFRGRALVECRGCTGALFRGFTVDGNRAALEVRAGLAPYDVPFARFTANNGILLDDAREVRIEGVRFREIAGFAVLASRSRDITIREVAVADSGSRNSRGRNNTTGGILLEEGTANFRVEGCRFENIRGNAVWTHSLYTSPRNRAGVIADNRFQRIGRDAIQVGHATEVRVERNEGSEIGYPAEVVDTEGQATPVAIDTAGNTDRSVYASNRFSQINGKCIDLDGFHHGEVRGNVCSDVSGYGIVMNNSNPDMRPEGVRIEGNEIRRARYGGIFVVGSGNTIARNRLLDLNQARCDDCGYPADEPGMLRSGIYLGRRAERPAPARGNVVEANEITGYRMAARCVGRAPGIGAADNTVRGNRCRNGGPDNK